MPLSKQTEKSQQTGYQALIDQESLEYEKTEHSQPFPIRHGLLSYRTGFWALSLLYILTAAFSFLSWPSDSSPDVASYGIIDSISTFSWWCSFLTVSSSVR